MLIGCKTQVNGARLVVDCYSQLPLLSGPAGSNPLVSSTSVQIGHRPLKGFIWSYGVVGLAPGCLERNIKWPFSVDSQERPENSGEYKWSTLGWPSGDLHYCRAIFKWYAASNRTEKMRWATWSPAERGIAHFHKEFIQVSRVARYEPDRCCVQFWTLMVFFHLLVGKRHV